MILVYADEKTPRLEYTVRLIFQQILGSEVEITTDFQRFELARLPKINYSDKQSGDELFLPPAPLLFSTGTAMPAVSPIISDGETGFFGTPPEAFLPFDPFASAFLIVSRMEEYTAPVKDQHGRFPAAESLLSKHHLLEKAVVNRWVRMIADKLEERVGHPIFKPRGFTFLSTIDVDNAWAYRNKGLLRTTASLAGKLFRGDFPAMKEHAGVLAGKIKDPYDNYGYLCESFRGQEEKIRFFFLLGDLARYDRQVSWKNSGFRGVVRDINRRFRAGLHPSYAASSDPSGSLLRLEKARLERITGKPAFASRFHFLRLRFPESYRQLAETGITDDFSMGYPDQPGFRSGICTPYYHYDLSQEQTTRLLIHPFQVMDVTLKQYLGLTPEEAIEKIKSLMEEVRYCGGTFCSIWHNESLSDKGTWKGYRRVFEIMNETGFRYGNT